jgi:hypothetical protein
MKDSKVSSSVDVSSFLSAAKLMPSIAVEKDSTEHEQLLNVKDFYVDGASYEQAGKAYLMYLVGNASATVDQLSKAVREFATKSATKTVEGHDAKYFDFYIVGGQRTRSMVTACLYKGDLTQAYQIALCIKGDKLVERFRDAYKNANRNPATPHLLRGKSGLGRE